MRTSRRSLMAGGVAAGLAAILPTSPARAQAQALKIGVILPRSGYLAPAGQSCQRGVEIATDVLADLGHKVEIVSVDFESNVDLARTQAEKLIADGAQVLVGAFDSGGTSAIAQVCEQKAVPLVINVAAAPQITEQGFKYVFRNFPTSPMLVRNGLSLMKDLFKATNVTPKSAVFIHANDTFGQANRQAIDRLFPTLDMPFKLVDAIAYDPKAQDLAVEVAKCKASGADLVIVTTRAGDAIRLVREMVKQRYEPKAIISPGSPGMYDEEFYEGLGPYADYSITNLPWPNFNAPITKRLGEAFARKFPKNRFGVDAFNVGFTFEALLVAADAAKRAGSRDSKAIAEALRTTNVSDHVMTGGVIAFDAKGQNNNIGSATVQNLKRTPTVVLPAAAATAKPVFPVPGWRNRT
jgi:branched-chain amino acid transport system substrate-binding protein